MRAVCRRPVDPSPAGQRLCHPRGMETREEITLDRRSQQRLFVPGLSVRQVRRLLAALRSEGAAGPVHGNTGVRPATARARPSAARSSSWRAADTSRQPGPPGRPARRTGRPIDPRAHAPACPGRGRHGTRSTATAATPRRRASASRRRGACSRSTAVGRLSGHAPATAPRPARPVTLRARRSGGSDVRPD